MSKPDPGKTIKPAQAVRQISLAKGGHTFVFKYRVGEESTVLEALANTVKARQVPFDWFDAAVLSHQLGQHLSKELQGFVPKK